MIIFYDDDKNKKYRSFSKAIYATSGVKYPEITDKKIEILRDYPVVHGIPVIFKPYGNHSFFTCIDIISSMADRYGAVPCKDFTNLISRIDKIQRRAMLLNENDNLIKDTINLMDEELAECYDKLLYLYIGCPDIENLVDYTPEWRKVYEDEIEEEFLHLGDIWLFKDVISTMIFSKNLKKCLYDKYGWTEVLIKNADRLDKII